MLNDDMKGDEKSHGLLVITMTTLKPQNLADNYRDYVMC